MSGRLDEPEEEDEDEVEVNLDLGEELDLTTDVHDLTGLADELARYENNEVVRDILRTEGSQLRERAVAIEGKLHQVELDSIQDYVTESDNLVALQQQIRGCDSILEKMESLLGGFQSDLGKISTEIKHLQEQSFNMSIKLRNRKAAESFLGQFVEDLTVQPKLISNVLESEVNESYLQYLVMLHNKLEFTSTDARARSSAALQDVEPELERLRAKAAAKVREFLLQRFYGLRKPKTNIQILQQNVLLKYKYFAKFLQQHGTEVFPEVRGAYIETLGRIYQRALSKYLLSLGTLQVEVVTKAELLGAEESRSGLFRGREGKGAPAKQSAFALGARAAVLQALDATPPLVVHQAESAGVKHPYEVLFRSAYKLLIDTATSEYLFCHEFWQGDHRVFGEIFQAPIAAVEENLSLFLATCHDAIALILMIRITHEHQVIMSRRRVPCLDGYLDKVNMLLWPRFKVVFDAHLASVRTAAERQLFPGPEELGGHYVVRRYAELACSVYTLSAVGGDGQLDNNLERLRTAVCDLLLRISKLFPERRQQIVFLVNNCDMVLAIFQDAGADDPAAAGLERTATAVFFGEQLQQRVDEFVEEALHGHFRQMIEFVKRAEAATKQAEGADMAGLGPAEVDGVMRDFASKWKGAIEQIHSSIVASFSNSQRAMDILQRTLSQLLIYYNRLTAIPGAASSPSAISNAVFMSEIKRQIHR